MVLETTDDGKIIVDGREADRSEFKVAVTLLAGMLGYQLYMAASLGVLQGLDKLSQL